MDIWKILGIEPTTDKKTIRKAYAAKTRVIHPEERPEAFQELHEAYQAALGYAAFVSKGTPFSGDDTEMAEAKECDDESAVTDMEEQVREESVKEEEEAKDDLRSFFEDHQEKQQKRVDEFIRYWQEFQSPYRSPEVLDWWKEYLNSEAFQEIRHHPQVMHVLAEEIDDKFFYGISEVKLLFWDACGFQADEGADLQGDRQRLWRSLYPAFEKREESRQNEKKQEKYNKGILIFAGVSAAVVLAVCILTFVSIHRQREGERRFLVDYMTRQYPDTAFSEPKRLGRDGFGGEPVYSMQPSAHPEMSVTATVECQYVEGEKAYLVREDYGQQLFEYYAAQYGLEAYEGPLFPMLYYPDIGQADVFCESVERMFSEQKELQTISEVAVGTNDVLFPEILMLGGVESFPVCGQQIYDLRHMEASALSAAIREAYMVYMFQYESWNITAQQYREWGAAYEKICKEWENDNGEWHEVYDPDTGEYLCRLFIPTYQRYDGYYGSVGDMPAMPKLTRMITVGNAYYFLQDREADLSVSGDGGGFTVKFYGTETRFGLEPEVKFSDLRNCY